VRIFFDHELILCQYGEPSSVKLLFYTGSGDINQEYFRRMALELMNAVFPLGCRMHNMHSQCSMGCFAVEVVAGGSRKLVFFEAKDAAFSLRGKCRAGFLGILRLCGFAWGCGFLRRSGGEQL